MAKQRVGAIPVRDGRRLVGVLTDRDVTARCHVRGTVPVQRIRSDRIGQTEEGECPGTPASGHRCRPSFRRHPVAGRAGDPARRGHGLRAYAGVHFLAVGAGPSVHGVIRNVPAIDRAASAVRVVAKAGHRRAAAMLRAWPAPRMHRRPGALSPWNALTQRYSRPAFQAAILSPREYAQPCGPPRNGPPSPWSWQPSWRMRIDRQQYGCRPHAWPGRTARDARPRPCPPV